VSGNPLWSLLKGPFSETLWNCLSTMFTSHVPFAITNQQYPNDEKWTWWIHNPILKCKLYFVLTPKNQTIHTAAIVRRSMCQRSISDRPFSSLAGLDSHRRRYSYPWVQCLQLNPQPITQSNSIQPTTNLRAQRRQF